MITERTLKRWRKEALEDMAVIDSRSSSDKSDSKMRGVCVAFLKMTQELLDAHLLRKK